MNAITYEASLELIQKMLPHPFQFDQDCLGMYTFDFLNKG